MTRVLPDVLVPAETLSLPELCAARLDGEVVSLDGCFVAVDTMTGSAARAAALGVLVGPRAIAEKVSALWLYGILASPPCVHTVCVDRADRAAAPHGLRVRVGQSRFLPGDLSTIGCMRATSPVRTLYDLLRLEPFGARERGYAAELLCRRDVDARACVARIGAVRNLPGRHAAIRRLDQLAEAGAPQPALTRYTS